MKGPRWSAEQRETVRQHYGRLPVSMIARATGRSESGVRNVAASMGVRTGNWNTWTTTDLAYLRRMYAARGALWVAIQLRRSQYAVSQKAAELGLVRDWARQGINRNGHRLWTPADDAQLLARQDEPDERVAVDLNRSLKALIERRAKLRRRAAALHVGGAQGP